LEESSNEEQKTEAKHVITMVLCITQNPGSVGFAPSNSGSILLVSLSPLHAEKILRFDEEAKANRQWLIDLFTYFIYKTWYDLP
jgi:hypothetical protein